jgi:hypothetical protein
VQEIQYSDHLLLSAIRPRYKTITDWDSAEEYLTAILQKRPLKPIVDSLAPCQLEVICYEFLRASQHLYGLLLPIGRTLRDIDIFGMDKDGNKILAQVTHSEYISRKLEQLFKYQNQGTKLFFFGPGVSEPQVTKNMQIQYVPIEQVFRYFWEADENSIHRKLIKEMLLLLQRNIGNC